MTCKSQVSMFGKEAQFSLLREKDLQVCQSSLKKHIRISWLPQNQTSITKRFVHFLKRSNRVARPEAHSRWSKERSPAWQESITRILWYWVRLIVLIQCFFGRLVLPLSVLMPRDTNTRACCDLPQACLPEKVFSHAKGFCLLTAVIKMEMCKQRLDTNNSVMSLLCVC